MVTLAEIIFNRKSYGIESRFRRNSFCNVMPKNIAPKESVESEKSVDHATETGAAGAAPNNETLRLMNNEQQTTRSGEFGDIVSTRDVVAGTSSLQMYDASGNVSQTTDANANIIATLSYDTFGVVTDNSGPANPTVAWQGKQGCQFESTLGPAGLQYVRQRWYDPATRQFISPDPLGFGGGDVNLFRYAGNNPVNRNDPGGEQFGNNFGQMGGGFSLFGPLVPSAPLQNSMGVQSPHAVQHAIIAHMPTHTSAERLAKQEALRSLNEPIDVASLGRLFTALIGFPFVLAYEGGKSSYHQAVANTTVLATRHLEHGGSPIGAGAEAISYNMLSWLGIKNALESGTGVTLVHPHRLSTPQRFVAVGLGALQVGTLAIPEIREIMPAIRGTGETGAAVLRESMAAGARQTLRPAFGAIGELRFLPYRQRLTLGVRLSRLFLTRTQGYAGVEDSPLMAALLRRFPALREWDWEQGHWAIQQKWFREGSPNAWYTMRQEIQGLRRVGNAGWNLLPMPRALNQYLATHPNVALSFGIAVPVAGGASVGGSWYLGRYIHHHIFDGR